MKKFVILLFLFAGINFIVADEEYYYHKLTEQDFIDWMKSTKIPEYTFRHSEVKGSEQTYNIEYSAMFSNIREEMINPRIGHPDIFYQYEDLKAYKVIGPYDLDGFPAVFIYNEKLTKPSNMTYLLVQMPNLNATFSITALTKERLTKESMEVFFRYFNLKSVDNSKKISWLPEIPIAMRLNGDVIEISKNESKDALILAEVTVKVMKTDDFLRYLRKFYNDNKGWLDLVRYNKVSMVCQTTKDFSKLEKMKDGEIIEFIYYISK
ncbi:hypothetical protein D9V86_04565 [Bacteroidetes/Chlorobi group bacterium ChocPot_Mid]|jgi:hypothetical protein|nr:MAG: hypothetical protein D9V86_04565 [Bacteroidetes/Chlorobi group bacterium ChocPot_Mid]